MIINASLQVVPLTETAKAYALIDQAIGLIQKSGLKYTVGSLSTELEGEYDAVQALLKSINDLCYSEKPVAFLIYARLHFCGGKDISSEAKIAKFR